MVPVFNIHLSDGTLTGVGTALEFNHWNAMGVFGDDARLGDTIGNEPAALDEQRKAQWAAA